MPADAILVLGCRLRSDGRPGGQLRRRVALAVSLYQAGLAPVLLLSGGGSGPVSEAQVMRELALAAGIPPEQVLCDPGSRNTVENAILSRRVLCEHRLARVVLVSSRLHLFRARLLCRLAGIEVVAAHGVATSPGAVPLAALHELLALPWSLLRMLRRGHIR
jgi:uncharacterized SAM-binding protein YcdF (DUF218 family)